MSKQHKFSALSSGEISAIVADLPDNLNIFARLTHEAIKSNPAYAELIAQYNKIRAENGNLVAFLDENLLQIKAFLNDCELIGCFLEKDDPDSFTIGADGIAIIATYLAHKPINAGAHEVETIKNTNLETANGARRHGKIFLENEQVHEVFCRHLQEDLRVESELNKTYIIEVFGTTGGNHVVALTVRKRAGEIAPLFALFDSSPALTRNGLEAAQNSAANGWCSQLILNATLKKACAECGLEFRHENFFANSEPMQSSGFSYCATFAYEAAFMQARMSRIEHEEFLRRTFIYDNPYGGKTEIDVRFDERGYVANPDLRLPAQVMAMSHYVDTALRPRKEELSKAPHVKKDGSSESVLERVGRYQDADGLNQLTAEKVFRQKIGHLFEIVASPDFRARASMVSDEEFGEWSKKVFRGNPYFPNEKSDKAPSDQMHELVRAMHGILPRFNHVMDAREDDKFCNITFHLGAMTTEKLVKFMEERKVGIEVREVDFSRNLVGVNPDIAKLYVVEIQIEKERASSLIAEMKEMAQNKKPLYTPQSHPFEPQKKTALLSAERLEPKKALQNSVVN